MGQRLTRRFLLGALALAALAGAGCDRKTECIDTLSNYNQSLFDAGRKLGQTMAPAMQGGTVNADQVKEAYDELVETLDAIKKDFATLKIPQTASGKRLAAGYAKFLRGQRDMIRNDLSRIVRMIQRNPRDRNLGPSIMRAFQAMQQREQREGRELQKLLEEFARDDSKAPARS
jgi:hypothetical protein